MLNSIEFSLFKIHGEDASQFLQGQLTCDINALDGSWNIAAFCNPKGRAIALLRIWKVENDFYALIEKDNADSAIKRLSMYILRSKVTIEEIQANFKALSIENEKLDDFSQSHKDGISRLSFGQTALLVGIQTGVTNAPEGTNEISMEEFSSRAIKAGLPVINSAHSEEFIPQMLNLDLLGGINFQKGCYTGQEIIARLHYRGSVKQRLCLLTTNQAIDSLPDDLSLIENSENANKKVGEIIYLAPDRTNALAVLRTEAIANDQAYHLENGLEFSYSTDDQNPELISAPQD